MMMMMRITGETIRHSAGLRQSHLALDLASSQIVLLPRDSLGENGLDNEGVEEKK